MQYDDTTILPQLELSFSYFFHIRVKIENTTRRWVGSGCCELAYGSVSIKLK